MPATVAGPGKVVNIEGLSGSLGNLLAEAEKVWNLAMVLSAGLTMRYYLKKADGVSLYLA